MSLQNHLDETALAVKSTCLEQIEPANKLWDEFDRAIPNNPHKYSDVELSVRKLAINQMERDYPNLPPKWLEWSYDWIKHTSQEERDEIIAGKYDKPLREVDYCGIQKTVEYTGVWQVSNDADGNPDPELPYTVVP